MTNSIEVKDLTLSFGSMSMRRTRLARRGGRAFCSATGRMWASAEVSVPVGVATLASTGVTARLVTGSAVTVAAPADVEANAKESSNAGRRERDSE